MPLGKGRHSADHADGKLDDYGKHGGPHGKCDDAGQLDPAAPVVPGIYEGAEGRVRRSGGWKNTGNIFALKKEEIQEEKEREEYVLRHNYPELSEVLGYVYEKKKLWARTNSDDDFLDIRIGSGNIPLKAKLNCSPGAFRYGGGRSQG